MLNVARKFLCLAAQRNIDLTCNYWKGTREERGSGRVYRSGKDVGRRRQPRSATVCNTNEPLQRLSGSVTACNSPWHQNTVVSHEV